MLFTSYEFLLFLGAVLVLYFGLGPRLPLSAQRALLVGCSLFFYQWWNLNHLPLLVGAIVFNYYVARKLYRDGKAEKSGRKLTLALGLAVNILTLGYFKYRGFAVSTLNSVFDARLTPVRAALPLAISFFTFQQIAFLVDAYHLDPVDYGFLQYALFISFFPQLIMGPICHHKELVPQFNDPKRRQINYANLAAGLFLFAIGMAKKSLIADPLAAFASSVYFPAEIRAFTGTFPTLLADAAPGMVWMATLSYTVAYYFDLSGYADMAMGIGKILNIDVPANFNSPFLARNLADFWRRWHMTLSRFLGTYVNGPMRGSDIPTERRLYISIMITFFISGLWHGAGWTFMVWGLLNGVCVTSANAMQLNGKRLPHFLARVLTMSAVILLRALFVAPSLQGFWFAVRAMFGLSGASVLEGWGAVSADSYALVAGGFIIAIYFKNSTQRYKAFKPTIVTAAVTVILILAAMTTFTRAKPFLYFVF